MKKGLICGVSGQDGAYLAQLLLQQGYEVYGTSRDAQVATFKNLQELGIREHVRVESMALSDFRSVLQVLSKVKPDEIYNLAGQSSVALSFQQPVETMESICIGTLNLLEAVRFIGAPVKLYNAASGECYGETNGAVADETTPFRPRSPYAVAKAAAFWEVVNYREAYGLHASSGILFNHESPLRPERFVTRKVVAAACRIKKGSGEKLRLGNVAVRRDWGWSPEYVKAMWLMMQQKTAEDYVVATGKTYTLEEFVEAAFSQLGLQWREHVEIDRSLFRPSDIHEIQANPAKAERDLGWKAKYAMPDVVRMMIEHETNRQP